MGEHHGTSLPLWISSVFFTGRKSTWSVKISILNVILPYDSSDLPFEVPHFSVKVWPLLLSDSTSTPFLPAGDIRFSSERSSQSCTLKADMMSCIFISFLVGNALNTCDGYTPTIVSLQLCLLFMDFLNLSFIFLPSLCGVCEPQSTESSLWSSLSHGHTYYN